MVILFTGSFAAISTAFGYSSSITTGNFLNTTVGQGTSPKEIPDQVKNFILNQIVHKSKAAIVIGIVDPNGTRVFSFGNMSKAQSSSSIESTKIKRSSLLILFS
jgi:hypothetical protein